VKKDDVAGYAAAVEKLQASDYLRWKFKKVNSVIIGKYSVENVVKEMEAVYAALKQKSAASV
ncbi:MAG: hypothetical protein WCP73_06330, partial [Eubacteriales bacterium]